MSLSKFTVPTDSVVSGNINATNGFSVSASNGIRNQIGGDGSNKFGYLTTNRHAFTGSVNITGSLSASSTISASAFFGDGSGLKNTNGNSSAFVDGTGKSNYIARWKDENTLTSSIIYQNNNSIGINIANPLSNRTLDVNGVLGANSIQCNTYGSSATVSIDGFDTLIIGGSVVSLGNGGDLNLSGGIGTGAGKIDGAINAYGSSINLLNKVYCYTKGNVGYSALQFGNSATQLNNHIITNETNGDFVLWRGTIGGSSTEILRDVNSFNYFQFSRPIVISSYSDGAVGLKVLDSDGVDTTSYAYYAANTNDTANYGGPGSESTGVYSIICSGRVKAIEFNATSDSRIKTVVSSSKQESLNKFKNINIVDYEFFADYRDADTHKGVLAQELEALYPAAVKLSEDYVPDIYKLANILSKDNAGCIIELQEHGLLLNDNIMIITPTKKVRTNVISIINNNQFKIDSIDDSLDTEEAFIYGRFVKDFRTVNYNELTSATIEVVQELLKKQEEQENKINSILARLEALENK